VPRHITSEVWCAQSQGDRRGTVEDFDKDLNNFPGYLDAYHRRALAKASLGDKDGAVQDLRETLRLEPNDNRAQEKLRSLCGV